MKSSQSVAASKSAIVSLSTLIFHPLKLQQALRRQCLIKLSERSLVRQLPSQPLDLVQVFIP
jgi:hypothetical protein